jgi:predicted HicB family RNase H-like nuclease
MQPISKTMKRDTKTTKTNPIGEGTVNLTVNVDKSVHQDVHKLAKKSNMKLGEYVRAILSKAIENDVSFKRVEVTKGKQ